MLIRDLRAEAARLARSIHDEVVQALLRHLETLLKHVAPEVKVEVLLDTRLVSECKYMPDITLMCKRGDSLTSIILIEVALTLRRVADAVPRMKELSQLISQRVGVKTIPIVIYVYDKDSVKGVLFDRLRPYVLSARQDIEQIQEPIILLTDLDENHIRDCAEKIAEIIRATVGQ